MGNTEIRDIKINHLSEPIGISSEDILFSFIPEGEGSFRAEIIEGEAAVASRTVKREQAHAFGFDFTFEEGKSYELKVTAPDSSTASAKFETGIKLDADFITPEAKLFAPIMTRRFKLDKVPTSARLAITALGLYRAEINGKRVGEDYLTPGFNDYTAYLRFQTYDVTEHLTAGENVISVSLGDGWYKGRLGIDKSEEDGGEVFGDKYLLAAKLYSLGDTNDAILLSDGKWTASGSPCLSNSIYDGEVRDYTAELGEAVPCVIAKEVSLPPPTPQNSAPIVEVAELTPVLCRSPKGETILDFKQNMVGFVRFRAKLKRGQRVVLSHGEVLQNGCFYNGNLRTARQQAVYISDGSERTYEPMFTYFGFRYVKVEGIDEVTPSDFSGVVISSGLKRTSACETDSAKINRLIENAVWGQRGNFLDVPTDCPQRDERLGWTADAQVFSRTACYQMDSYPIYRKYLGDLRADQMLYYGGDIPMYSPSLRHEAGSGGAVWADAATILPTNLYEFYGDICLLKRSYPMMRDYVEHVMKRERDSGGLVKHGFTFGDWLAQDGVTSQALDGGTDKGFIMSVYHYNSLVLLSRAADKLGKAEDCRRYSSEAGRVREAILDEYFAPNGKLALDTQTSYVLSLYFGIYRCRERVIEDFKARLAKDLYKIKTGFTGTPLLLPAMFMSGMDDDAFRILYSEECPGWLYEVNMGATTVWERWNSILPDGRISGTNMNSLNHYAYGSVCEAIYSFVAGLRPAAVGFTRARIEPHPNYRMKRISLSYDSPSGTYLVEWRVEGGEFKLAVTVPTGCEAEIIMPGGTACAVGGGRHSFSEKASDSLTNPFTLDTPNIDILNSAEAAELMRTILPRAYSMVTGENGEFKIKNGRFLASLPMFGATKDGIREYESALRTVQP